LTDNTTPKIQFHGKKSTIFVLKIEEFFSQHPEISQEVFCEVVEMKKMDKNHFAKRLTNFKGSQNIQFK